LSLTVIAVTVLHVVTAGGARRAVGVVYDLSLTVVAVTILHVVTGATCASTCARTAKTYVHNLILGVVTVAALQVVAGVCGSAAACAIGVVNDLPCVRVAVTVLHIISRRNRRIITAASRVTAVYLQKETCKN
jgi:hypothetical protein